MKKVTSMMMVGVLSFGLCGGVAGKIPFNPPAEKPVMGYKSGKVILVPTKPVRGIPLPVDPTKRLK